jgi:hypothetical protein
MNIVAEEIRTIPWPDSGLSVRAVRIDGRLWFVAADLCRALDYALSSNGHPNVTQALAGLAAEDRCFGRLETDRGSLRPYSRLALTSPTGLLVLAARKRAKSTDAGIPESNLLGWIAKAVAEVAAREVPEDGPAGAITPARRGTGNPRP